jgi:hypothetical protein
MITGRWSKRKWSNKRLNKRRILRLHFQGAAPFGIPRKRIKLHPRITLAFGANRGGIDGTLVRLDHQGR